MISAKTGVGRFDINRLRISRKTALALWWAYQWRLSLTYWVVLIVFAFAAVSLNPLLLFLLPVLSPMLSFLILWRILRKRFHGRRLVAFSLAALAEVFPEFAGLSKSERLVQAQKLSLPPNWRLTARLWWAYQWRYRLTFSILATILVTWYVSGAFGAAEFREFGWGVPVVLLTWAIVSWAASVFAISIAVGKPYKRLRFAFLDSDTVAALESSASYQDTAVLTTAAGLRLSLRTLLALHKQWLETEGHEGARADLTGQSAEEVSFRGTDLRNAVFKECRLRGADFTRADLTGSIFSGAILDGASLHDSILEDADLANAIGLQENQLSGASVAAAALPTYIKFDGLKNVEEASQSAVNTFYAMLLGCAYSWLAIAATTDASLIANGNTTVSLPILQTQVPLNGFYLAGPAILLFVFIYFHLSLQQLWQTLASLPAFFTDGTPLNRKAYPWLPCQLVEFHFALLKPRRNIISYFTVATTYLVAWFLVPITVYLYWFRCLPNHDLYHNLFRGLLFAFSLLAALGFHRAAALELGRNRIRGVRFEWGSPMSGHLVLSGVLAMTLIGVSWLAYSGWNGWAGDWLSMRVDDQDLSAKPIVWDGDPVDWEPPGKSVDDTRTALKSGDDKVTGANFRNHNLRCISAQGAFIVNADLRKTDLEWGQFRRSNLRWAKLWHSDFNNANLGDADLRFITIEHPASEQETEGKSSTDGSAVGRTSPADRSFAGGEVAKIQTQVKKYFQPEGSSYTATFIHAYLANALLDEASLANSSFEKACLSQSKLRESHLESADFEEANLTGATIEGGYMGKANLDGAVLYGADLHNAHVEGVTMNSANLTASDWRGTHVSAEQLCSASYLKGIKLDGLTEVEVKKTCAGKLSQGWSASDCRH